MVRVLSVIVLLLFFANVLSAQEDEQGFVHRFAWTEAAFAFQYEVLIEQMVNGVHRNVLQEFTYNTYILTPLPPGNYRMRVIPFDFRGLPGEGTPWRYFRLFADGQVVIPSGLLEMVRIPAGTFTMGSNEIEDIGAQPAHTVTLTRDFYMSKHLVTQSQFYAVMGRNPSHFTEGRVWQYTDNFPVEMVSWYDAIVFCNLLSIKDGLSPAFEMETTTPGVWSTNPADWGPIPVASNARWNAVRIVPGSTGYRLPTEAQWEYACRAGTTTPWNTGVNISVSQANFNSVLGRTSTVGYFAPNAWGLYDMHGNVWEWVWDWFGPYSSEAQIDPMGAYSGYERVFRGGGAGGIVSARHLRSASRGHIGPALRLNFLGFRVVLPVAE